MILCSESAAGLQKLIVGLYAGADWDEIVALEILVTAAQMYIFLLFLLLLFIFTPSAHRETSRPPGGPVRPCLYEYFKRGHLIVSLSKTDVLLFAKGETSFQVW